LPVQLWPTRNTGRGRRRAILHVCSGSGRNWGSIWAFSSRRAPFAFLRVRSGANHGPRLGRTEMFHRRKNGRGPRGCSLGAAQASAMLPVGQTAWGGKVGDCWAGIVHPARRSDKLGSSFDIRRAGSHPTYPWLPNVARQMRAGSILMAHPAQRGRCQARWGRFPMRRASFDLLQKKPESLTTGKEKARWAPKPRKRSCGSIPHTRLPPELCPAGGTAYRTTDVFVAAARFRLTIQGPGKDPRYRRAV